MTSETNCHTLLVLEDLQASVSKLNSNQQSDLNSFLTKSRHKNLSILYIVHRFPFNQRGGDFDKSFFENLSHIAIFKFLQNNLHVNLWASRIFTDQLFIFKHAFELAQKIAILHGHNRPYVLVTLDQRQPLDTISRIRLDIFGFNLILKEAL